MKSTGRSVGIRPLTYKSYRMVDEARPVCGRVFLFSAFNSVVEDTAYILVVAGSNPAMPIASYGVNSNSLAPD